MNKHIFVATDGSDTAARAVDWAAEVAARFDVPLTIAHVLQHGRPVEELGRMAEVEHLVRTSHTQSGLEWDNVPGNMGDLLGRRRTADETSRLITVIGDEIVARAADRAREMGVKTVDTKVGNGDYADEILEMAERAGADMIVVGRRGLGRLRKMLMGSVSGKIVQAADVTVVTVR